MTLQEMLPVFQERLSEAAEIMIRDRSTFHVFDFGTGPDGKKLVTVITIIPAEAIAPIEKLLKSSAPIERN